MTALVRRIRHRLLRARSGDDGFTLLETIVSFVLFAIVASAATAAVANSIKTSNLTRDRVVAANVAQQDIENARALVPPARPASTSYTVVVGDHSYSVARTINYSSSQQCPTIRTAGTEYYINLTDVVTPVGGTRSVTVNTVIAC